MSAQITQAAKLARLMFDMGAHGHSKEAALAQALKQVPAGMFSGQIKAALRKEFNE